MLSGMSPGGLFSVGIGDSEGIGASEGLGDPVVLGGAAGLGGPVDPLTVPAELVPPQADNAMAAARAIGARERVRVRIGFLLRSVPSIRCTRPIVRDR